MVRHPQPPPILGQRRASGERACFSSSLSSAYRRGLDSSKREVTTKPLRERTLRAFFLLRSSCQGHLGQCWAGQVFFFPLDCYSDRPPFSKVIPYQALPLGLRREEGYSRGL